MLSEMPGQELLKHLQSRPESLNTRELLLMEILIARVTQDLTTSTTLTRHLGSAGGSEMVWQIPKHATLRVGEKCCTGELDAPLHKKDAPKRKCSLFPILPTSPRWLLWHRHSGAINLTQDMSMYGQGWHSRGTKSKPPAARDTYAQGMKQRNGSHWANQASSKTSHYQQGKGHWDSGKGSPDRQTLL